MDKTKKKNAKASDTEPERKLGAPRKRDDQKVEDNGLTKEQNKQLRSLHLQRNVPVKAIIREAVDWYLEALEMGRKVPAINHELETAEEADIDQ